MEKSQETNNDLLKKIGRYSAAAGTALLAGNMANAAVSSETAPVNLTFGSHYIDLDGDGHNDVRFTVYSSASSEAWASIDQLGSADMEVEVIDGIYTPGHNGDPGALPLNFQVGATLTGGAYWASAYETIVGTESGYNNYDGNFNYYAGQTRYLGIRYSKDGGTNWYYGWMAIKINTFSHSSPLYGQSSVGQISEWSFSSQPNTAIFAGSGTTAVPLKPIASALGLGLVGLMVYFRSRRKNALVNE
jgi:hypothetical protein